MANQPPKRQKYNTSQQLITTPQEVYRQDPLNGFSIVNRGNSIVLLNTEPIMPNEAKAIGGNEGEVYIGKITIGFDTTGITPPFTFACWITQKFFVDSDGFDKFGK